GDLWNVLSVDRLLPYDGMAFAAGWDIRARPGGAGGIARLGSGGLVGLALVLWAAALEAGKLLIVGGSPKVDNVLVATAGVLLGLGAFAPLARWGSAPGRGA